MLKRIVILIIAFALLLPGLAFAQAPETLKLEKMEFWQGQARLARKLQAGDIVDIRVELSSPTLSQDFTGLQDQLVQLKGENFSSEEKPTLEQLSQPEQPLRVEIRFPKLQYQSGDQLEFELIGKNSNESTSYQVALSAAQAKVRRTRSIREEPPLQPQPELIYRFKNDSPELKPGQKAGLTLVLQNVGATAVTRPVLRIKASQHLSLPSGSSSRLLSDIAAGDSLEVPLELQLSERADQSKESLSFELHFTYDSGRGTQVAYSSDQLDLQVKPVEANSSSAQLSLRYAKPNSSLAPGDDIPLELEIVNTGAAPAKSVGLQIGASEQVQILDNQTGYAWPEIAPGQSKRVKLQAKISDLATSGFQYIDFKLKFDSPDQGDRSWSEKLNLAVQAETESKSETPMPESETLAFGGQDYSSAGISTPPIDSAVPNVLIKKFGYGKQPVAAGKAFELELHFENTSPKLAVENIVMAIEPGESFAIDVASNVYHIPLLKPAEAKSQKIQLKALPSAKTGANGIEVSFRYEYVDNDKRSQANLSQKLAVPIYQPDRFEISPPQLPEQAMVGEEISLNLAYVNKGKSEVSNVEAIIEGPVYSVAKQQNLGNFESGKSGNIGFLLTPEKPGTLEFQLIVNYEDANQEVKRKSFPVRLKVEPAAPESDPEQANELLLENEDAGHNGRYYWMGAGVLGC